MDEPCRRGNEFTKILKRAKTNNSKLCIIENKKIFMEFNFIQRSLIQIEEK